MVALFLNLILFNPNQITSSESKFTIKDSKIVFYSYAPIENIQAENTNSIGVVDFSTGEFIIKIPMNKFDFPNNLMEKHFNDSYLETEQYPNCIFKGTLSKSVDLTKIGSNDLTANGKLDLHGISKELFVPITINIGNNSIDVISDFEITLKDFKIKIPKLLFKNIAEVVEIKMNASFEKYISE